MDKDNTQEPMITSNSPSLEKGREKVYYSSNPAFYVGIDCIIFGFYEGEISLLLLKRNFEPAMGEWSLMGGFVQNNESVDDAAKRVLHELTGLENVYMEQVGAFGASLESMIQKINTLSVSSVPVLFLPFQDGRR